MMAMHSHNVPALRLDGFEDEWEEKTVQQISVPVARVNPDSTAPVMMISAADGFINQSEKYSSDNAGKSLSKYIELHQGELAYNHGASKIRPFGSCFELRESAARVPFVYHCFRVPEEHPTFTSYSLNRKSVQSQLERLVSSGARMDGLLNISFPQYGTVTAYFPTLEEQQAIGAIFTNLDAAINQHSKKHQALQQAKTALMQRMFPQEGQTVPELRLEGFDGEWKTTTLGELGSFKSGVGFPEREQGGDTGLPFYKVSDLSAPGNELQLRSANHYVTEEQIVRNHWIPVTAVPAILFAKVGAAVFLGRKRLATDTFLLDNNLMAFSLDTKSWDVQFADTYLKTVDLTRFTQSGALPSLNARHLAEAAATIPPTLEEQQAIGAVFTRLDTLIATEAKYIESLKQTKTALLQRMYI